MIPIGLCSIVALAFSVERWIRLRPSFVGSVGTGRQVLSTLRDGGVDAALATCEKRSLPLTRILATGLRRAGQPFLDREKAVEDAASVEVKRMSRNLRPLLLIYQISPLLGLLGTVWGMVEAFSEIAGSSGLGKPELLAAGIYQALMTTAAGLTVAIPAVVLHHYLSGRVALFTQRTEEIYRDLEDALSASATGAEAPTAGIA